MLAEKITISKYKILTKYSKLDEKVKTIIEKLYGIEEFNKEYQLSSNLNIKAFKIDKIFLDNIKSNNELRSMCRKKRSPNPLPSLAPSIIPGISAITKDFPSR